MNKTENVTTTVVKRFKQSAERVFDAWLDPEKARKFLFNAPNGTVVTCDIDARVGGKYLIVDRREGEDIEHSGEYKEIDRPHRLVFTFGVPKYSDIFTLVEIDINPVDGGCELTLVNSNVLPEYEERNIEGWTMILDKLGESLGIADGG